MALVAAALDPMDRDAHRGPANHRQVQNGNGVADATPVFARAHIQAQMQSILNAPIPPVGVQHLPRRKQGSCSRAEQPFGFDLGRLVLRPFGVRLALDEAREPGGLLDGRKADLFGRGVEVDQTARFGAAAVEFITLDQLAQRSLKKKRAANARKALAPFGPPPVGCP